MGYDFELEDRDARVVPSGQTSGIRASSIEPSIDISIEGESVRALLASGERPGEYFVCLEGRRERLFIATAGDVHFIHLRGRTHRVEAINALDRARALAARAGGAEEIRAPMPGVVVSVAVAEGDAVPAAALLLTIESMKLQTAITASHAARVAALCVGPGDHFDQGAVLVRLEPVDDPSPAADPADASAPIRAPRSAKKGRKR